MSDNKTSNTEVVQAFVLPNTVPALGTMTVGLLDILQRSNAALATIIEKSSDNTAVEFSAHMLEANQRSMKALFSKVGEEVDPDSAQYQEYLAGIDEDPNTLSLASGIKMRPVPEGSETKQETAQTPPLKGFSFPGPSSNGVH